MKAFDRRNQPQSPRPPALGARKRRLLSTLALIVGLLLPGGAARAAIVHIDATNPTGMPDITQGSRGICSAPAMANIMWEWSEHAPYNGTPRLVDHRASVNPLQNWPATWGNWSRDSLVVRGRLEFFIYQEAHGVFGTYSGHGPAGGTTKYLAERGHLFSSGFLGFGANPGGLSVRTYNDPAATYPAVRNWLLNAKNEVLAANVATHWLWHKPDGSFVMNGGETSAHAMAVAGLDTNNQEIRLTNGWGTQQQNANPVNPAYYDRFTGIVIDNTNGGNPNNKFRIPANANNNGVVRGITNAQQSDYMEMYQFLVVKSGGSPSVGVVVTPAGSWNQFRYLVDNPEPDPQHHFYLEIPRGLDRLSLGDVQSPPGWAVEFWNPAGAVASPPGSPADGKALFGAPVNSPGSDFNLRWTPSWGGLHWYWTGSGGAPIEPGRTLEFSFLLDASVAYSTKNVALTVVGEAANTVHYYNMVGGPSPATFFVPDDQDDRVYMYDASWTLLDSFALGNANTVPNGVAVIGSSVYVLDRNDKQVYRYAATGGAPAVSKALKEPGGTSLSVPSGLAIEGDDLWVVDDGKRKIYRYSVNAAFSGSGTVDALQHILFTGGNASAEGLATDGAYLYVLDDADRQVYRYSHDGAETQSRVLRQVDGSTLSAPAGLKLAGSSLWVVDRVRDQAFEYDLGALFSGSGNVNARSQQKLAADNGDARGL